MNDEMKRLRDELVKRYELEMGSFDAYNGAEVYPSEYFIDGFDECDKLWREKTAKLLNAAKLGLSFAPKGEVPKGFDSTFYHTLEYNSEVHLQKQIDEARALVAEFECDEKAP